MNSIISLHRLTELLAKATGKDRDLCGMFLRVFSSEVGEALGAGGILRIKGFGQFKIVMADNRQRVVFIPEREMADAINSPFACFDPVELAPGVSEDVFASVDDDSTDSVYAEVVSAPEVQMTAPELSSVPANDIISAPTVTDETSPDHSPSDDASFEKVPSDSGAENDLHSDEEQSEAASKAEVPSDEVQPEGMPSVPSDEPLPENVPSEDMPSDNDTTDSDRNATEIDVVGEARGRFPWFWVAIAYIAGMAIGFGLGFFGHDTLAGTKPSADEDDIIDMTDPLYPDPSGELGLRAEIDSLLSEKEEQPQTAESDSLTAVTEPDTLVAATPSVAEDTISAPEPPKGPVYEKITPKVTLNSLALKYYGNKVYWVYIFLDNQDKIKNPNNVLVGTRLRIPPKEQYDVSPTDEKANIEAALRKQSEIYSKYGVR